MENKDLFEDYDSLPNDVKNVLEKYGEIENYNQCESMLKELNQLGYTFDYGLDHVPFNLTKIIKKMHITILNYSIPKIFTSEITEEQKIAFEENAVFYDSEGNNIYYVATCHYLISDEPLETEHI